MGNSRHGQLMFNVMWNFTMALSCYAATSKARMTFITLFAHLDIYPRAGAAHTSSLWTFASDAKQRNGYVDSAECVADAGRSSIRARYVLTLLYYEFNKV